MENVTKFPPFFLTFDKRDRCNLRAENDISLTWLEWRAPQDWYLIFATDSLLSTHFRAFAKDSFNVSLTPYRYTEQAARIPSYYSDWESQNKLKFSRHLNLSPYQEIGLKLRKFGTQYSYKINNNTSFIIITEHISPSLSTFIGCKWEKTVKVQTFLR